MKNFVILNRIVFAVFALFFSSCDSPISDFQFSMEPGVEYVKLVGSHGCNFIVVGFSLKVGETQAVNKSGMTTLDITNEDSFLITITRTSEGGFTLKGIEGTAWEEFSFKCQETDNCSITIDQNGAQIVNNQINYSL